MHLQSCPSLSSLIRMKMQESNQLREREREKRTRYYMKILNQLKLERYQQLGKPNIDESKFITGN